MIYPSNSSYVHPKFVVVGDEILCRKHLLNQFRTWIQEQNVSAVIADVRSLVRRPTSIQLGDFSRKGIHSLNLPRTRASICRVQNPSQRQRVPISEVKVVYEAVGFEVCSGLFHELKELRRVVDGELSRAIASLWETILVKLNVWQYDLIENGVIPCPDGVPIGHDLARRWRSSAGPWAGNT